MLHWWGNSEDIVAELERLHNVPEDDSGDENDNNSDHEDFVPPNIIHSLPDTESNDN